ncbi:fibrobacter succinogenes major paralogous domain-containing protein [uncultured Fibrobacter sp.]|uniref:fibrobacter succinogenes major paralogous domain-containing protein n=1 Tax=uncultured Fibrobacter sp. TaxID=261512 RepID=UPI0025DA3398|nr:fibrobacter succinogenes major paralogous domain-containing protein [uncultured Fibrobacter sp.]
MSNLFSKQSPWGWRIAAIGSVLFISAMFAACGDEVSKVTEVSQAVGVQVVDAGKALPKCTADNEGAMVYSVDSAATYTCIGTTWTSMKGKDGKDGADGKNGKDGKNGANGAAGAAGSAGADGDDGSSCTVKALKNGNGYKIVCGGDSVGVVLNGQNGAKGDSGVKGDSGATGNNGLSAYEIAKAGGYKGSEEEWIASLKGDTGAKGDSGVAGSAGCSAVEDSDGVKITCPDGNSFTLRNGTDGKDGNDGYIDGWILDYRDKHLYRTVTIGKQTWMAENLNYEVETGSSCYNDTLSNCQKYGRFYTWAAAVGKSEDECGYGKYCNLGNEKVRGICPEGWHLPDTTEWGELNKAVGGRETAGKKLKSTEGWNNNGNGTDDFGFSAVPISFREANGDYRPFGVNAFFMSSEQDTVGNMYDFYMGHDYTKTDYGHCGKNLAFPIRCLKD